MGYGDDKLGYKLWDPKKRKQIRNIYAVFREDQTIENFKKENVTQEQSQKNFEEGTKLYTLVQGEEEAENDTPIILSSDEEGEDDVVDDNTNNFVNDVGQEQMDFDQGEPTNMRRSTRELIQLIMYQSSEYVKITEYGEPQNFS